MRARSSNPRKWVTRNPLIIGLKIACSPKFSKSFNISIRKTRPKVARSTRNGSRNKRRKRLNRQSQKNPHIKHREWPRRDRNIRLIISTERESNSKMKFSKIVKNHLKSCILSKSKTIHLPLMTSKDFIADCQNRSQEFRWSYSFKNAETIKTCISSIPNETQ